MIKQCSIHGLLTSMLLIVFSLMSNDAIAQKAIRGTVLDEANEPIIGASVLVKGTTNGSITGVDGTFNVKANPSDVLVISYVGYATVEQQVGNQTQLVIHLREDSKVLNDVVVIGYGSTTKKELTGSVTSMKKDDLNPGTFTNAMGMLQGKVAGLQIINPNGADPTAKYEVLLRGTNTLSAGQGPLIIIDGVAGADIRNINFQEVESIDVLKDGSAAAIYGTRGTNGVIIVTTKRARSGKTEVSYDGQLTVGVVSRRAKPLSASEYKSVIKEYRPELESYIFDSDTDWFKEITQTPFSHKHNLSISGGSEKFSHHTSFNYEKSDGLQKHNSSEKLMARTNIRQSLLDKWVDLDYNLNIIHRKYSPSSTSAFMQAFTHNPTEPVYDDSDPDAGGYSRIKAMEYYNPVAIINERNMESKNDNYGANIRATLNILPIKGLKWENFVSYDKEQYETREYYTHYYPSLIGTDDNQTHNIGTGTNLTEGKASMSSNKEDNTYIGFFGRFMYNYDDKYLLSASLRRDGSSRFGDNNKWGWFPAVSVGWRINKEKFLSNVKWIDDLKLRAGYGVTGNQDFSNYKSLMMMTTAGKFYYNGQWINTYQPASNANPDLKWEKKAEFNVGVDEFTNGTYKVGWSTSAACYTQRLIEGQSLGTFYGPIWLGTDTDGKDVLLGQNADGSVPEEQWEKIGCAYPDATLSWSNTFRYKKFDLSFSLRASIGGEILNNYAMEYENLSSIGLRNISSNWLSQTNFTSTTYKYSSKYIEDASYLKLDNVTFGYTWDFTSKMIKRLRLSLTAQNIFCITGYSGVDPEVALSGLEPGMESLSYYPRTTEFTFGVNIVF